MVINKIYVNEINPHLRYINKLQCDNQFFVGPRKIYDNQFLYVKKGKGIIKINNVEYEAKSGDLFYYGPTIIHEIIGDNEDPFLLMGICFDYTKNYRNIKFPIGSLEIEEFDNNKITEKTVFYDFNGFEPKINIGGQIKLNILLDEMLYEFEQPRIYYENIIDGILIQWLTELIRYYVVKHHKKEVKFHKILEWINNNYSDTNLNNKNIADQFHYHPNYLNQLMKINTGISLHQYIINIRIQKALDLLMNTNMNIQEISKKIGYEDIHYFSRIFRKKVGSSPSNVRVKGDC